MIFTDAPLRTFNVGTVAASASTTKVGRSAAGLVEDDELVVPGAELVLAPALDWVEVELAGAAGVLPVDLRVVAVVAAVDGVIVELVGAVEAVDAAAIEDTVPAESVELADTG